LRKHSGRTYLSVFPYSSIAPKSRSVGSFEWTDLYLNHYDSDLSKGHIGGYMYFPSFNFEARINTETRVEP